MRAAIRTKAKQERLVSLWLKEYWDVSLAKVPQGPRFMEEALINVRVRNFEPQARQSRRRPSSHNSCRAGAARA